MELLEEVGFQRKSALSIEGEIGFSCWKKTHDAGAEALLVEVHVLESPTAVARYCELHKQFFLAREGSDGSIVLVYEFRKTEKYFLQNYMSIIKLHQSIAPVYRQILRCSVVLCSNATVRGIVNTIFATMYAPVRPVRLLERDADAAAFIRRVEESGEAVSVYQPLDGVCTTDFTHKVEPASKS